MGDSWIVASYWKELESFSFSFTLSISFWKVKHFCSISSHLPFQVSLSLEGYPTVKTSPLPTLARENREEVWYVLKVTLEISFIFSSSNNFWMKDKSSIVTTLETSLGVWANWKRKDEGGFLQEVSHLPWRRIPSHMRPFERVIFFNGRTTVIPTPLCWKIWREWILHSQNVYNIDKPVDPGGCISGFDGRGRRNGHSRSNGLRRRHYNLTSRTDLDTLSIGKVVEQLQLVHVICKRKPHMSKKNYRTLS